MERQDVAEDDTKAKRQLNCEDMTPFLDNYPFAEPLDVADDTESDVSVSESDLPPFLDNYPVVASQETEVDGSDEMPGNDIGIQGYLPSLRHQTLGWSKAIVISDRTGTHTDTSITGRQNRIY
ncbi:MAG: hypothetical protein R2941_21245 [Desulfobacterales bacterium]